MKEKKVVFITGASTGIGHASTSLLLDKGFTVYATARRVELMNDLEQKGAKVLHCDVTSDKEVNDTVNTIIKNEGKIDILFANAGFCLLGPVELQNIEDVRYQFDVNVLGNARVLTAVLPHMRKQKSGRVIITSSSAGHVSLPCMPWYAATKHAQQGLGDGLRMEVKEFGIKVSLIEPGYVNTDIDNGSFPYLDKCEKHPNAEPYKTQMKNFREKWGKGIDKGASPNTIAKAVLHAAQSSNPRRRYCPNMDAKFAKFAKRWMGYGLLDAILPSQTIK